MRYRTGAVGILITTVLATMSSFAVAQDAPAAQPTKTYEVAIFIKNRAREVDDDKVTALDDLITSRLADGGFHVIGREDTINAVSSFAKSGPNAGAPGDDATKLDKALSDHTSALHLTQSLNADYVLVVSITTYGKDSSSVDDGDVHALVTTHTLRASYKLLDGVAGGAVSGGVVTATTKDMQQPGQVQQNDDLNNLLDQAATKISDSLIAKAQSNRIQAPAVAAKMAHFDVIPGMTDLAIPEVTKDDGGNYVIGANKYRVEVMACTIELDGITLGSTPGPFTAAPGLHKIRISREGFSDWERTISIRNGLHLSVDLQMSPEGYARWKDSVAFLQDEKDQAKLSDASVKRIEGIAKMFSQSGFKVDMRSDVKKDYKIDAKASGTSLWPADNGGETTTTTTTTTGGHRNGPATGMDMR